MQLPPTNTPAKHGTPHQPGFPAQGGEPRKPYKRRRGRFGRFVRGYLMLVGTLTTFYVLVQLLVRLFVELDRWIPSAPIG